MKKFNLLNATILCSSVVFVISCSSNFSSKSVRGQSNEAGLLEKLVEQSEVNNALKRQELQMMQKSITQEANANKVQASKWAIYGQALEKLGANSPEVSEATEQAESLANQSDAIIADLAAGDTGSDDEVTEERVQQLNDAAAEVAESAAQIEAVAAVIAPAVGSTEELPAEPLVRESGLYVSKTEVEDRVKVLFEIVDEQSQTVVSQELTQLESDNVINIPGSSELSAQQALVKCFDNCNTMTLKVVENDLDGHQTILEEKILRYNLEGGVYEHVRPVQPTPQEVSSDETQLRTFSADEITKRYNELNLGSEVVRQRMTEAEARRHALEELKKEARQEEARKKWLEEVEFASPVE